MFLLIVCQQIQNILKFKYLKQLDLVNLSCLGNLGNKALTNINILLARNNLPGLLSNLNLNGINKIERKIREKGAVRAEKDLLYLF